MKITILGTGAYGLALAIALEKNKNNEITMWTKLEKEKDEIEKTGFYQRVLPDVKIKETIKITTNLKEAVDNKDLIIYAIPIAFIESVCLELKNYITNQHHCISTKGIEQNNNRFVKEIIESNINTDKIAVLSGASFAIDTVKDLPIGLTLASNNNETNECIINAFSNTNIKLETSEDYLGVELCGAIKNVIAIACGILDGLNANESTKAMLITNSINDIKKLINQLGGNETTIFTYAGIGDLLLTCTSTKSRNFSFGKILAQGSKEEINDYIENNTIEGRYTLKSINQLLVEKQIEIPIINLMYKIIYQDINVKELLNFLMETK